MVGFIGKGVVCARAIENQGAFVVIGLVPIH